MGNYILDVGDESTHSGLVTPSVPEGTAILRALALGADLRLGRGGWRFVNSDLPPGWTAMSLGSWWLEGVLRDASIEWVLEDSLATRENRGATIIITEHGRKLLREIDDSVLRSYKTMRKPLPIDGLREFIASVRKEHPDEDQYGLAQIAAINVLAAIFGDKWVETHVVGLKNDFFRFDAVDEGSQVLGRIRLLHLAEMVFNLQYVPGLAKSLRMIHDGDIEGGFAELEVGRLLHMNERQFEFIAPKRIRGQDYDLEISFDDVTACGETKCKLESTTISEDSLVDTLNYGRRQLPSDRPGMLFVKIPQTWHRTDDEFTAFLKGAADRFFRGTGRVVSLKFHTSLLMQTEVAYKPVTLQLEIPNPKSRFYPGRDWTTFRLAGAPPPSWVVLADEFTRKEKA